MQTPSLPDRVSPARRKDCRVVVRRGGAGVELQRLLEGLQGVYVVLFVAEGNSQEVVALDTGRILLELVLYFRFGLVDGTLAKQFFGFLKKRRSLRGLRSAAMVGSGLLRKSIRGEENHQQRKDSVHAEACCRRSGTDA